MENNLTSIVHQWLSNADIRLSRSYLNYKLSSHPSYPSILSITDTLDELGIENAALVTDKEKLDALPVPFLIDANGKGTEFLLIDYSKKLQKQTARFFQQWDGIVIVIEKPTSFNDTENNSWLIREKLAKKIRLAAILFMLMLAGIAISFQFHWLTIALLTFILLGMTVAMLVVQHELGISNDFTKQLCTTGKNTDCNAVLGSAQSSLFSWLNFSDLGITWYSSQFLLLTISLFIVPAKEIMPLIALLNLILFPLTILSLYYQRFVIGKWCPLCLITILLTWSQTALLFHQIFFLQFDFQLLRMIGFAGAIFFPMLFVWTISIKPMLIKQKELTEMNFRLQRFRNNSYIFETVLHCNPPADITPWPNDLQIGNPHAPIQLTVACNPYCAPCARTHDILNELIEKRNIGLTIRFTLSPNKEDKITQAVDYILQLLKDKPIAYKRKALHNWYSHMNMETFKKEYQLHGNSDVSNLLQQHESWSKKMAVRFTPTIFINEYQLPGVYSVSDLPVLISGMINKMETTTQKKEDSVLTL